MNVHKNALNEVMKHLNFKNFKLEFFLFFFYKTESTATVTKSTY